MYYVILLHDGCRNLCTALNVQWRRSAAASDQPDFHSSLTLRAHDFNSFLFLFSAKKNLLLFLDSDYLHFRAKTKKKKNCKLDRHDGFKQDDDDSIWEIIQPSLECQKMAAGGLVFSCIAAEWLSVSHRPVWFTALLLFYSHPTNTNVSCCQRWNSSLTGGRAAV